jgi:DNA-binding LacI/PurR family transcriptional regulator
MENKLKPDGYELIYDKLPKSDSSKSWQECLHKAKEFSPSALLIFPDAGDNKYIEKQKAEILDLNTRILMLNRGTGEVNLPNTSFVTYDILDEGIKIAKILSSEASSRLIYISSENPDCYWDKVRLEGLVIGLSQASSNNEKKLTIFKGEHKNYSKICNIIKTNSKVKPPVIIPVNNQHAAKFMDIARAKGLNAPENFRLISFDDNPMYRTYNISTLAHPLVKTGEIFANLIKSPPQYHENCNISIMLCSHFIRRNTF